MGNTDDKPKLYSFDSTSSNVSFILHKESVLTEFYAELTAHAIVQPLMKQHSVPCSLLYNEVHEESMILKPQMKYLARCMNEYNDDIDVAEEKGKVMSSSESTKVQKICEKCIAVFENKEEMSSSRKEGKNSIKDNNSSIKDDTRFNSIHSLNVSNQEQLLNITSTSITIGGSSNNNSNKKAKVNVLELPKGICYKKKSISPKRIEKDSINANNNASLKKQTITSSLASTKNTSLNSSPLKTVNPHHALRKPNINTTKPAVQHGKQTNTKVLNIGTITNVPVHRRCTSPQMNKHSNYNKGDSSYVAIKMQQQRNLSGNVSNNTNKNINVSKCKSKSPKKMDNNNKKSSAKYKAKVKTVFELDLSDLGEDAYDCSNNINVVEHQQCKQQPQQQQQLNKGINVYNTANKLEKLKKLQQQRMNSNNTSSNNSKQFQTIITTTAPPSKVNNDISSQQSIPINYYECDSLSISDYLTNKNNNTNYQDNSNTPTEVVNTNNNNNGTPTSIFSFKKKIHPSVHKEVTSTFKVNAKLSDTEFKDIEFLN